MADIFVVLLMSTIGSFLHYSGYLKSLFIANSSSALMQLKHAIKYCEKLFRGMVKIYLGLLNVLVEIRHKLKA